MTSINFKVIGLTRTGFENAESRFEPATFGFLNHPEWEVYALLIRPPPTGLLKYGWEKGGVCQACGGEGGRRRQAVAWMAGEGEGIGGMSRWNGENYMGL